MSLPNNFASQPAEDPHRYFRNICHDFVKKVKTSKNIDLLQEEMERFINASREMNWHNKNTDVYHKDAGEKATDKVWSEFKRYIFGLLSSQSSRANSQDLLNALAEVERLIHNLKVT